MRPDAVHRAARSPGREGSDLCHVRGFCASLTRLDFEFHLLPLMERSESTALDGGEVHEHVRLPLRGDETVALPVVEPLDQTTRHGWSSLPQSPRTGPGATSDRVAVPPPEVKRTIRRRRAARGWRARAGPAGATSAPGARAPAGGRGPRAAPAPPARRPVPGRRAPRTRARAGCGRRGSRDEG